MSEQDIQDWLKSLSGLDDAEGKVEQLRVCRELLQHAPEDDMLTSDRRIIKRAIQELEEELDYETHTPTLRHRRPHSVLPGMPEPSAGTDDDSGDDENDIDDEY